MVESLGIVVGQIQCKDASVGFPGPILSIAMSSPRTRDGMPLNEEESTAVRTKQFIIRVAHSPTPVFTLVLLRKSMYL